MSDTYKVVRFYQDPNKGRRVVDRGLTLKQAQAHCNDPETSSRTATGKAGRARTRRHGDWFDGYEKEGK